MNSTVRRLFLSAAVLFAFSFSSFCDTTDPVGAISKTLLGGGKYNLISKPFLNPIEFQGPVVSISGTEVEIADASGLTGNLYLEVESGAIAGVMSRITNITGNTLTLADDYSSQLNVDDIVIVRQLDTINSIFGSDNKYGFKDSPTGDPDADNPDTLLILDATTGVIREYFYVNIPDVAQGWYDTVQFQPAGNVSIFPDTGMISYVAGPDVDVVFYGEVQTGEFVASVFPGFNIMSIMNPVSDGDGSNDVTLGNSGIYTGDPLSGVTPSPDGDPDNADLVYILDSSSGIIRQYFYVDWPEVATGWFDTVQFNPADHIVLRSGTAVYIQRRFGSSYSWDQFYTF